MDFSVTPSITTRPVSEYYGQLNAIKIPLLKMAACLFPYKHTFLNNVIAYYEVAYTQNLEEICGEIQKLWDIE